MQLSCFLNDIGVVLEAQREPSLTVLVRLIQTRMSEGLTVLHLATRRLWRFQPRFEVERLG